MIKNEPMLTLASFFWSDTINAFLFGHGPIKGGSISGLGRVSAVPRNCSFRETIEGEGETCGGLHLEADVSGEEDTGS